MRFSKDNSLLLFLSSCTIRLGLVVFLAFGWLLAWNAFCAAQQPELAIPTIAIIQPRGASAYQEAMQGFLETLRKRSSLRFNTIVYESAEELRKTLRQTSGQPDIQLIVTVGTRSTIDVSQNTQNIPIVFSMVLDPEKTVKQHPNIVGASLNTPAEFQFEMIREVLPMVKSIGILYDPKRNERVVTQLEALAPKFSLKVRAFPVTSPKDIPQALSEVKKKTDALLGIVDSTVYSPQMAQFIIGYTAKEKLPFIGFSLSYVKAGALGSLVFDNWDIGRQTAELAERVLSGFPASLLQNTVPEKINLALNLRTAKIIDVTISMKIRKSAKFVYE